MCCCCCCFFFPSQDEEQKNKLAAPLLPEEERTANDVNVAGGGTPQAATKFGWIKGVLVSCFPLLCCCCSLF